MANAVTNLTSGSETWTVEQGDTVVTASVTIPNNSVAVLSVILAAPSAGCTIGTPTTTGLTWTEVSTLAYGSRRRLSVFRTINTTGSGVTETTSFSVSNAPTSAIDDAIWHLDSITGCDTTTPLGTAASNSGAGATSGTVTVSGTPDTGDFVYATFAHTGAASDMTINGELSNEVLETGGGGDTRRLLTAYDSTPDSTPVPGVSWTGAEDWAGVAFIVNVGSAAAAPPKRSLLLGIG